GRGGFEPGTGVHFPATGKSAGNFGPSPPNIAAPPAESSASVALPACTSFTSPVFEGGISQRLASYVSMQTLPTFTESGGHLSVPDPADAAAARQTAATPMLPC